MPCLLAAFFWVVGDGFFGKTMILTIFVSVVFCLDLGFVEFRIRPLGWVWVCFSTESLILAQDERWRRA